MEDRSLICNLLLLSLQETRELHDLMGLAYDYNNDYVHARFRNGSVKSINVHGLNSLGIVKEVVKRL